MNEWKNKTKRKKSDVRAILHPKFKSNALWKNKIFLFLFHLTSILCSSLEPSIQDLGTRTRIAFCQGKEKKVDPGTPLTDRIKIGEDFTLTISSVKPSDELNFTCQVTDPAGSPDGTTSLKVFCKFASAL